MCQLFAVFHHWYDFSSLSFCFSRDLHSLCLFDTHLQVRFTAFFFNSSNKGLRILFAVCYKSLIISSPKIVYIDAMDVDTWQSFAFSLYKFCIDKKEKWQQDTTFSYSSLDRSKAWELILDSNSWNKLLTLRKLYRRNINSSRGRQKCFWLDLSIL